MIFIITIFYYIEVLRNLIYIIFYNIVIVFRIQSRSVVDPDLHVFNYLMHFFVTCMTCFVVHILFSMYLVYIFFEV